MLAPAVGILILADMFPQKLLWASLAVAMLGCGPLLQAEDAASVHLALARSEQAVRDAGAPIPQSAESPTQHDLLRQYLDWYKRRLLPPIQVVAKGQPWESAALKFADDSFAVWVGLDQERTTPAWVALAARGDDLIKSGCDELAIRFLTAHSKLTDFRNRKTTTAEYRRILDQLEKDPRYPKVLAFLVAVNLRSALPTVSEALDTEIVDLLRQSFEEGSYSGADDALF
jgi:hypothetical protein